jgi:putative ABC transport system permease protein
VSIGRLPAIVALRLRTLFRRAAVERDLTDEIRYHIDRQTDANIAAGMSPRDARRAAVVAFGGAEQVKEASRDAWRHVVFAELAQDARYAWRIARRTPLASLVAVVTVGAAVAVTTSVFTVVNGVLVRALPYPEPDRLALIFATRRGDAHPEPVSFTNAMDWRRDTKSLASLATFSCTPRPILNVGGSSERASLMEISTDFFGVLGVRAALGRVFDARDYARDAAPVVVITDRLWRTRFGGSARVVSSTALVDGAPVTIAGVLAPDFAPLPASLACRPDLYRPLESRYDDSQRSWSFLRAIARLAPGATVRSAQAELDVENERLASAFPDANRDRASVIMPLRSFVIAPFRVALVFAQAGSLLVLLIACANVAGLLLARASSRQRELSVRVALGASRARLARQVFAECGLLGIGGGILGAFLAVTSAGLIARWAGDAIPDPRGLTLDWRVLAFAILMTAVATTSFALAAIAATLGAGERQLAALRDGARSAPGRTGVRRTVVIAQLAMASIVLVGSGLLVRSYRRLLDVRPGFDPNGVLTARVTLPEVLYPRGERQVRFFQRVLDRLASDPRVAAAGAASILPESYNFDRTNAKVVGRSYAPGQVPSPDVYRITPGYFSAMRIPILAGRRFTPEDDDIHPLVAIVNEMMATAMFPNESAVGKRIWTGAGNAERTIVGVVGDTHQYGLDRARTMQLYVPHADNSGGDLTLVIRAAGIGPLRSLVEEAVRAADPGVPLDDMMTMNEVLAQSTARRRLLADLSFSLAIVGVVLAAIGLYGVVAYSVAQRTPEIGLRMALGANARTIVAAVSLDVARLVFIGLAVGLAAAFGLARLITPLLFGIASADVASFAGTALTLVVVALVASAAPAARAARINPSIALRGD